ncbi:MAG: ATP-binding protein [Opitutales bacterium]
MPVRDHAFVKLFPAAQAERLCRLLERVQYADDAVIFPAGAPSDSLYLVLSGHVVLTMQSARGQAQVITRKKAGGYFGELGALDGSPRSTSATAEGPVLLARLPSRDYQELLGDASWPTLRRLFTEMSTNLRSSNERYLGEVVRKEKLALIGEMANAMVHDFRSPFSSIQLAIELLGRDHPDEKSQRYCDMVLRQVKRLSGMVEELLEFSRGETRLNLSATTVRDVLREARENCAAAFVGSKVRLVLRPIPLNLTLDAARFQRVLQNLLNNAREALANRRGGRVTVSVSRTARHGVLEISDNGPGIPGAIRRSLFQPFVTHGKSGGTGLGLAIAKSVVELHGGTIRCRSSRRGTTFIIQLPLKVKAAPA